MENANEYQPRTAQRLIEILRAKGENPRSLEAEAADEIERLRKAIEAIKLAAVMGKVCDDVAWFSDIETLHDFCDATLNPK